MSITINSRENRRDNQEWTTQRHWQHEGTIKNGQSRDTGNIGHKALNENNQSKTHIVENYNDEQHEPH